MLPRYVDIYDACCRRLYAMLVAAVCYFDADAMLIYMRYAVITRLLFSRYARVSPSPHDTLMLGCHLLGRWVGQVGLNGQRQVGWGVGCVQCRCV